MQMQMLIKCELTSLYNIAFSDENVYLHHLLERIVTVRAVNGKRRPTRVRVVG